jgi:hypothetical protein
MSESNPAPAGPSSRRSSRSRRAQAVRPVGRLWMRPRGRATLLIAKLDRLARNVAFIANLMDAGVEFRACHQRNASRLMLHRLAAVAEDEARRISERTRRPYRPPRRVAGSSAACCGQNGGEGAGGPVGACRERQCHNSSSDPGGGGTRSRDAGGYLTSASGARGQDPGSAQRMAARAGVAASRSGVSPIPVA